MYLAHAALLLGKLAQGALAAFNAALHICLYDGYARFALGCRRLARGKALAGALALYILLVHAFKYAVGRGVKRLKLVLGALKLALDLLILGVDRLSVGAELVQRRHPHGYFLYSQLVAQSEIALCGLRLLFQRTDLHFKLLYLVIDAQEVFLGLGELALRFLLAVAVARYARRLLEYLAPVGALGGDDVGDPALTDNGIAVAPKPRVHEEAVDILEADGLLVDVILAVAATVIAAGEHDLAAVAVEDMGGVVDDEADLREAQRAALLRAAEYDVLHLAAAQRLCALLAHDPEDRVGYVRLAGAVRTDDRGYILFKCETGLVREGLEPLYLQCF